MLTTRPHTINGTNMAKAINYGKDFIDCPHCKKSIKLWGTGVRQCRNCLGTFRMLKLSSEEASVMFTKTFKVKHEKGEES